MGYFNSLIQTILRFQPTKHEGLLIIYTHMRQENSSVFEMKTPITQILRYPSTQIFGAHWLLYMRLLKQPITAPRPHSLSEDTPT